MANPELKLHVPVEAAGTDQEFEKGPGGETNLALDSNDSYELKFNQNGTIRAVATLTGTQTLTNKTLTSPVLTTPALGVATGTSLALSATTNQLATGASTNITTVNFPASSGAVTLTMPNTTDTVVGRATTDTLTNKTLTAPVISGASSIVRTGQAYNWSRAKVGATAGWVLGGADNLPYVATMAASQTGGTLVIPLDNLKIGDTITGYTINAQVESAGGAVTIDAALRAVTNVAADPTDAAIGTGMAQVSVTADTAVSSSKTGHTEVVAVGKSYYILITATTAAVTDIILQHGQVTVTTS